MIKEMNIYFVNVIICQFVFSNAWLFQQPPFHFINYSDKLPDRLSGFMASFGDFNSDRRVDIFVLAKSNGMQHIDVILMPRDDAKSPPKRIPLINDTRGYIRNVFTGDFNGDSLLDVVTCTSAKIGGPYAVEISYGLPGRRNVESPMLVHDNITFIAQPLHLDWNADMIGDIFGLLSSPRSEFVVLIGNANKTFTLKTLSESSALTQMFDKLLFSYFVDLDQDGQADILLIGRRGKSVVLIGLIKDNGDFKYRKELVVKENLVLIGLPVIGDFLFNGALQMLFQFCGDAVCRDSRLMACDLAQWSCRRTNFSMGRGSPVGFQVSSAANAKLSLAAPDIVPMSCGDLKMSGRISCLVTMNYIDNPTNGTLVRLKNLGNFNFVLVPLEGSAEMFANVSQAAIFDLLEDGIPDIIIARQQYETGIMIPLIQQTSADNYFLKVMVLNGLCGSSDSCPGQSLPFGIPLPGVILNYSTEGVSGGHQSSMVSLVSTSSFTPLNLPYAFFGLSTFSNYIEKLDIQIPSDSFPRRHTLTFIVPKTQIVIIPWPLDDPNRWSNKLFIEPFGDKKVIYVAAALLGTMFFVSIILCILQYLEVRENRQEKMEEAQKFNFDAM